MNVKCFFCSLLLGVILFVYCCKILKFCFQVFCGDMVVSDGTSGLISMI